MTRRLFIGAVAGVCAAPEFLVLEAIAAEKMPHRRTVTGVARSPFFEFRDYGGAGPELVAAMNQSGIPAIFEGDGKVLIPFESLASREQTWREAGPVEGGETLREIAIYRCI